MTTNILTNDLSIIEGSGLISIPMLVDMLSTTANTQVFVKTHDSTHYYANAAWRSHFQNISNHELNGLSDHDLYDDHSLIKLYRQDDQQVMDTRAPLAIAADLAPCHDSALRVHVAGKLFPLCIDSKSPNFTIGIVEETKQYLYQSLEQLLRTPMQEINNQLTKRSYAVDLSWGKTSIARREIQCMLELLKGYHAGEIADTLSLSQTTIESYIQNLKNKLGACARSELISAILEQKLLAQIFN